VTAPAVRVAVLDVNETLFDLAPLRARLAEAGAPGSLLGEWFAGTLRDGFALAAAGGHADFRTIGTAVLAGLLEARGVDDPGGGAAHVLDGFEELAPHPDVAPGLERLREAGLRAVTLTNGNGALTGRLLARAGLGHLVEHRLSVDDVRRWKPVPEPYLHAVATCGVAPAEAAMVACHPWDVHGALRAGLRGAFLARGPGAYPAFFMPPDVTAPTLAGVADGLAVLS
jgi:2-haloacid dehalogenase